MVTIRGWPTNENCPKCQPPRPDEAKNGLRSIAHVFKLADEKTPGRPFRGFPEQHLDQEVDDESQARQRKNKHRITPNIGGIQSAVSDQRERPGRPGRGTVVRESMPPALILRARSFISQNAQMRRQSLGVFRLRHYRISHDAGVREFLGGGLGGDENRWIGMHRV